VASIRQPSFAGGEFSPTLWSRTDVEKYGSALRRLRNFVITPHGAAANRAGTRYGGSTKGDGWAWLLPFAFSDTDTLVLVCTAGALRFVSSTNGLPGYVESSPGVPYEIATPYAAADIPKLRYAQVGNVIRLACKGYELRELTRTSASPLACTFVTVGFDVPVPNGQAYVHHLEALRASDDSHPKRQWQWKVTELWRDQNGLGWETSPGVVTEMRTNYYEAWSSIITYPVGAYVTGYRSLQNGNLNHALTPGIAVPAWNSTTTYDVGTQVGYGNQGWRSIQNSPPEAANLNHPPVEGEWWTADYSIWWVEDGVASSPPPAFTDPLPLDLVLFPDKTITLYVPGGWGLTVSGGARLVGRRVYRGRGDVFGYVGEFAADTFIDGGDLPNWNVAPPQGRNPFKVYDANDALIRTEQPAVVAYEEQRCVLAHTAERPGYVFLSAINDYSNYDDHAFILAEDAFERELAAMKREEIRALVPGRVLVAFTNVAEWAISGAGQGEAISPLSFAARPRTTRGSSWVEPVKVGDDEVLFFPSSGNVVRELALDGNTGKYSAPDATIFSKHLFAGRQIVARAWQEEPWSILWVVLDDGKLLSFSYVAEHQLRAWAWHDTQGAVESVCCVREGAEDAVYLSVRRTVNGATKRYIERMDSRATVTDARRGLFLDAAVSYDGAPATHFAGLGHLEGCTVNALADGAVVRDLVVAGGAVDLPAEEFPDGASVVLVGLPYVSELELLDVIPGKGKERVKEVSHVIMEYEGSRGGYFGQAFDKKLEEWRQRTVAIGYDAIPLEGGDVKIPIASSWNSGGRAVIRQVDPLPLTITAVVREVIYGGG
jgi:hypothetical protein